jgi:crotonobetainyl-CoA:carnitine CoA-transferase CaiB-like acyl-CoA transferase
MTSLVAVPHPNDGALTGIRVIDLTGVVLGPYATQILGDYGADVIKIEPPTGDIMRYAGPAKNPGMGHIFINANRNKRSVVLDLKTPAHRTALLKLCATADVLAFNIRPASMARLGLSYGVVRAVNPRIVYCGAYGYSEGGPYSDLPAYDDLIQGAACLPWLMTQSGSNEPRYVPATFADRITALNMVHAVMAALIARGRTGLGQAVEVPMFESVLQFVLGEHLAGETWQPAIAPMGHSRMLALNRKPYATADGYICALMYNDAHWRAFLRCVGQQTLFDTDVRFSTQAARITHIDDLYGFVALQLIQNTCAYWLKTLTALDIPVMPMMKLPDLLTDPHLTATHGWQDVPHPSEGMLRQLRPPYA